VNKNQQAQALITAFINGYKERYGFALTLNRFKIKWAMIDVIDSVGYLKAKELIEYYFKCDADHSINEFLNTFDELDDMQKRQLADEEYRRKLREQTRRRISEL